MEDKNVRSKLRDQTTGYITGALGLVAGLAWNDAVKALIETIFPFSASSVWAKFIYALLITVVVVLLGQYIFRESSKS